MSAAAEPRLPQRGTVAAVAPLAAARWPRPDALDERLLLIDAARAAIATARVRDLPSHLAAGDLLVVNDAATLPASFAATLVRGAGATRVWRRSARVLEVRLLARVDERTWRAVLFGAGDWRTPTELRPPPRRVRAGDHLTLAGRDAVVTHVDGERLVTLRFDIEGAALWSALYRAGRPVQYAYLAGALELWHAQTPYAARPWAVEMPSAGRPLTTSLVAALRARGVEVAMLTHAAGLSSTGDAALDALLPLPERYDIPAATVRALADARQRGGRVVAVGTTVVRALEGCAATHGAVVAGEGVTALRIGPSLVRRVVNGVFTGMHDPASSHFQLLAAFAPPELLARAYEVARAAGFVEHEFGDSCLVWAPPVTQIGGRPVDGVDAGR